MNDSHRVDDCRGDQHDPNIVEYFLTENILGYFSQILQDPGNRQGIVAIQVLQVSSNEFVSFLLWDPTRVESLVDGKDGRVPNCCLTDSLFFLALQTLSILIQNVRNTETIYYFFSNNQINKIVALSFDFDDDEVLGLYVNLLKTISLKLDEDTIQFFFKEAQGKDEESTFPLYSEAIKFGANKDGMVRAAVKNLTLNTFTIPLAALRNFFGGKDTVDFLRMLSDDFLGKCKQLDTSLQKTTCTSREVENCLSDLVDELSYFNDIWSTSIPLLRWNFLKYVWCLIVPILLDGLVAQRIDSLTPLACLFVLELFFSSIQQGPLVSLLASLLLGGDKNGIADELIVGLKGSWSPGKHRHTLDEICVENLALTSHQQADCRRIILDFMRGQSAELVNGSVRLIGSIIGNAHVTESTLYASGLLPSRKQRQKDLLDMLTKESNVHALKEHSLIEADVQDGISSFPMRHSEIFESLSPLSEDRNSEVLKAILGCIESNNISPIAIMEVLWIIYRLSEGSDEQKMELFTKFVDNECLINTIDFYKKRCTDLIQNGPWSDAVPFLLDFYWQKQRTLSLRQGLRSCKAAADSWEHIRFLSSAFTSERSDVNSGAKELALSVMNLIGCIQILKFVSSGNLEQDSPIPGHDASAISWNKLRESEIQDGQLLSTSDAIPCIVVFSGSTEREILFRIASSNEQEKEQGWLQQVLPPAAVLLEDNSSLALTEPQKILSFAPVAGASPSIDMKHPQWLHVTIRPNASVLLKSVTMSPFGVDLAGLDKVIHKGRWVISFPTALDCERAFNLLKSSIEDVRKNCVQYVEHAVAALTNE